ncbi:hypothetical protein D3C72_1917820 [compost metagenome]
MLDPACEHLEQGGLAAAIGPLQADALLPGYQQIDVPGGRGHQWQHYAVQGNHMALGDASMQGRLQMNAQVAFNLGGGIAHALRKLALRGRVLPVELAG